MTPLQLRIALRMILTAYTAGAFRTIETEATAGMGMEGIESMLSHNISEERGKMH